MKAVADSKVHGIDAKDFSEDLGQALQQIGFAVLEGGCGVQHRHTNLTCLGVESLGRDQHPPLTCAAIVMVLDDSGTRVD
jgi:hypothetical protein